MSTIHAIIRIKRARILRILCPQPQSTAKIASPLVPSCGHRASRPGESGESVCPQAGDAAIGDHLEPAPMRHLARCYREGHGCAVDHNMAVHLDVLANDIWTCRGLMPLL